MKKEKKVVYGIEIVKPWSDAMYAHNEEVAEGVREKVFELWNEAVESTAAAYGISVLKLSEYEWSQASGVMKNIQTAITCYGFGYGYNIDRVDNIVAQELEEAPFYRLKDIAEELELELEKEFVGLS